MNPSAVTTLNVAGHPTHDPEASMCAIKGLAGRNLPGRLSTQAQDGRDDNGGPRRPGPCRRDALAVLPADIGDDRGDVLSGHPVEVQVPVRLFGALARRPDRGLPRLWDGLCGLPGDAGHSAAPEGCAAPSVAHPVRP